MKDEQTNAWREGGRGEDKYHDMRSNSDTINRESSVKFERSS
jgi:hypothetical protein